MSIRARFELKGDRELQQKLFNLGAKLGDELESATLDAASVIEQEAKANAPVHRGVLRDDIKAETAEKSRTRVKVLIGTDKKAFYAPFVELGTVKAAPHPFLRPAADTKKEETFQVFTRDITRILDDAKE